MGMRTMRSQKGRGCGKVEDSTWREHYLGGCGREQEVVDGSLYLSTCQLAHIGYASGVINIEDR